MLNSNEHEIATAHKTKMLKNKYPSCIQMLKCCIYKVINVKMTTIVGILTFMSILGFMLSLVEHEKFYNLGVRSFNIVLFF